MGKKKTTTRAAKRMKELRRMFVDEASTNRDFIRQAKRKVPLKKIQQRKGLTR